MIIRLAVRVVRGAHAEDDRSDDEDEGHENDSLPEDDDVDGDLTDKNGVEKEKAVASLSVANGNIPPSSNSTTNGIAFSNGIHQRKRKG
jgi:hypothetical protein